MCYAHAPQLYVSPVKTADDSKCCTQIYAIKQHHHFKQLEHNEQRQSTVYQHLVLLCTTWHRLGGGNFGVTFEGVKLKVCCVHYLDPIAHKQPAPLLPLEETVSTVHSLMCVIQSTNSKLANCNAMQASELLVCHAILLVQTGETVNVRGRLSNEQKQRRVVLKRVNLDRAGVR